MTRSDVTLCSWNRLKQSSSFNRKHRTLPLSCVSAKQSGWLQNLCTAAGTCVYCTNTCLRYQPLWPATWSLETAPYWHVGKHITNVIDEAVGQRRKQLHASMKANDITLNICYTKTYSFQSQHTTQPALHQQSTEENANRANTLHNRLFSVYRRKRVVLRNFHRSYLKANKVSKSEGTKKVKYAYHFWKCAGAVYRRLSKLVHACIEATACQSWRIFLRHSVVLLRLAHYRLSNWQTVGFIQKMPTVQHSVFQNC